MRYKSMSSPFIEEIATWQDFYMLTGSAAATLMGLIFVSVSLHIDIISRTEKYEDIRAMAIQTFFNFLLILGFAFIFMVPSDTPYGFGIPLLILGILGLVRTARLWLRFGIKASSKDQVFKVNQIRRRLLIPNTVCFIALIAVALDFLQWHTNLIDWMVMIVIWLTISATLIAWELMLRVGELKRSNQ